MMLLSNFKTKYNVLSPSSRFTDLISGAFICSGRTISFASENLDDAEGFS